MDRLSAIDSWISSSASRSNAARFLQLVTCRAPTPFSISAVNRIVDWGTLLRMLESEKEALQNGHDSITSGSGPEETEFGKYGL